MPNLYFAYGANMHPGNMAWRCPDALAQGAFVLRDWELKFYNHATIEPRPGAGVGGVLWSITDACEQSLDAFEGFPSYYTKRTWIQDGVHFFFYEMTDPKSGRPSPGYVQDIEASHAFWNIKQVIEPCY
jgi:Gamma-glutamyl cyclotransferase, AIG2-like